MDEESATPDLEEVTRRNFVALNSRDYDAILVSFAPDVVWDVSGLEVQKGHEAVRRLFEEWVDLYEDLEAMRTEFRDLGNGVTFTVEHQRARLPGSTGWVELDTALVTTWSDGLVARVESRQDIDEARAAVESLAKKRG
jgi:ketosteroid isomerase-like protein